MKTVSVFASLSRNNGGVSESGRRLHLALAELSGMDVTVLGVDDSFTKEDLAAWSPVQVRVFEQRGWKPLAWSPDLRRHVLSLDTDVLHTHGIWQYPSIAVSAWHRKFRRPYTISPQGMLDDWALKNSAWKKRIAGILYENQHLAQAHCLRALSATEAKNFRDFGLKNPVCIIPNSIDLPTENEIAVTRNEHSPFRSFAGGGKVLLYLGRIHPKKGLVNLIHAWKRVIDDQPNHSWVLAIAGWDQGGHEQELKKMSAECGTETSIHFIGPQFNEDKAACYQHCDAFVLPSYSEGLPMVVLEAWAAGKPALVTPECNLPEGFSAQAALRIAPTVDSITGGLRQLFDISDDQRQTMGAHGLALVKDRFTSAKVALQLRAVYEWMLGGGPPPECIEIVR